MEPNNKSAQYESVQRDEGRKCASLRLSERTSSILLYSCRSWKLAFNCPSTRTTSLCAKSRSYSAFCTCHVCMRMCAQGFWNGRDYESRVDHSTFASDASKTVAKELIASRGPSVDYTYSQDSIQRRGSHSQSLFSDLRAAVQTPVERAASPSKKQGSARAEVSQKGPTPARRASKDVADSRSSLAARKEPPRPAAKPVEKRPSLSSAPAVASSRSAVGAIASKQASNNAVSPSSVTNTPSKSNASAKPSVPHDVASAPTPATPSPSKSDSIRNLANGNDFLSVFVSDKPTIDSSADRRKSYESKPIGRPDNSLAFIACLHDAFRAAAEKLRSLVGSGRIEEAAAAWQSYSRASAFHASNEDSVVFPYLDEMSGSYQITRSRVGEDHEAEQVLVRAVDAELGLGGLREDTLEVWRAFALAHLDREEKVVLPLDARLGEDVVARGLAAYSKIMLPSFAANEAELLWTLGWAADVLGGGLGDLSPAACIGKLCLSFQGVTNAPQYEKVKEAVRSGCGEEVWGEATQTHAVDCAGLQALPAADPIGLHPVFEKYFKMVKFGVPSEAAASKMFMQGATPSYEVALEVLEADPDQPITTALMERLTSASAQTVPSGAMAV